MPVNMLVAMLTVMLLASCTASNVGYGAGDPDALGQLDDGSAGGDRDLVDDGGTPGADLGHVDQAPSCGALQGACCPGNSCSSGYHCVVYNGGIASECEACGAQGQPACPVYNDAGMQTGHLCNAGLAYHQQNGMCGCGGGGETCCASSVPCILVDEPCNQGFCVY